MKRLVNITLKFRDKKGIIVQYVCVQSTIEFQQNGYMNVVLERTNKKSLFDNSKRLFLCGQ